MTFKDLQYSFGKFSSDVKSRMAKSNPMHKRDTKALEVWISEERHDLAAMKTLAYHKQNTIKSFRTWAQAHEPWNESDEQTDIQDIGDKLATLLEQQALVEQQYAARYQQYRHALKSIRDRENHLCDIREKLQVLASRVQHLDKTNPDSPQRAAIEREWCVLDKEAYDEELKLSDFKRCMLREAYYIRFNAMVEYADKTKMIAGFGQYLVDLLDLQPSTTSAATTPAATSPTATMTRQLGTEMDDDVGRAPYTSASQAQLITDDCLLALEQWIPAEQDERPTITAQLDDDDREIAHDAALLTDLDIDTHHEERQQLQQLQQQQQAQEEQEKVSASTAPMLDDAPDAPSLPLSMPPPAYTPRPGAMGDEVRDEKFVAALPTPNEPLIDYFQLFDEKGSQIASFDAHADRRRSYAEFAHLYLSDESKKRTQK